MTRLRPYDKFPDWKGETCLKRLLSCAGALHVHGFLSDPEREKVQKRLHAWLQKTNSSFDGAMKGRPATPAERQRDRQSRKKIRS